MTKQVFYIYMDESVVHYLGYDPMSLESFRPVYQRLLHDKNFFVYEVSGDIAGFYNASRHFGRTNHVAHLGSLAVAPQLQGRGVAREMVLSAIEELKTSGVKRIQVIVESDNPRAISFYKRLGFKIEGTLRKFYKRSHQSHYVDDQIMSLLVE